MSHFPKKKVLQETRRREENLKKQIQEKKKPAYLFVCFLPSAVIIVVRTNSSPHDRVKL
jgi:hypothetical protein